MLRVWGADAPAPPRGSWASLLSPFSAPRPGIPLSPGCPGASFHWLGAPSTTSQEATRRVPVQCSPPRPLQSVPSYPQPQPIRLTSAPASRLLPLPPVQQPQAGRRRVRERARAGGGGSPLRSAHPLLSGRSALPLSRPLPALRSAAARAPPPLQARPGEPRVPGPRYPGNRLGDHSRRSPLPPTRTSWGYPLPKSRAPPANGHRGSWLRQGVG